MGSALCTRPQPNGVLITNKQANAPLDANVLEFSIMDKTQQFIEKTGASSKEARQFLQNCSGNLEEAIQQYQLIQSGLPPQGPIKNMPSTGGVRMLKPDTNNSRSANSHSDTSNIRVLTPRSDLLNDKMQHASPVSTTKGLSLANSQSLNSTQTSVINGQKQATKKEQATVRSLSDPTDKISSNSTSSQAKGDASSKNLTATKSLTINSEPLQLRHVTNGSDKQALQKLQRGFSTLADNMGILDNQRKNILQDLSEDVEETGILEDTTENTFVLPDLSGYEYDFRDHLLRTLVEKSTQVGLENTGHLNWWISYGIPLHLVPMATDGDGNCLLHAASLAMWGFHDRQLTLRTHLNATVHDGIARESMYRRWRWQQTKSNLQLGLTLSNEQWAAEWSNLLKLSSLKPKREGSASEGSDAGNDAKEVSESKVYESLEEFHVFVLAHLLRRPIIVIADTVLRDVDNEAIAPIPFGGIYLPVERQPAECYRSPLLLAYDAAHFSALVPSSSDRVNGTSGDHIPLVDPSFALLPLHFIVDPSPSVVWEEADDKRVAFQEPTLSEKIKLLQQYMDIHIASSSQNRDLDAGATANSLNKTANAKTNILNNQTASDSSKKIKRGVLNRSISEDSSDPTKRNIKKNPFSSLTRTVSKKLRQHLPIKKRNNDGGVMREKKNNEADVSPLTSARTTPDDLDDCEDILECLTTCQSDRIVCAYMRVKLPDYYDTMIATYLSKNREEYEKEQKSSKGKDDKKKGDMTSGTNSRSSTLRSKDSSNLLLNGVVNIATIDKDWDEEDGIKLSTRCINQNCDGYGTADRFYLCEACYQRQKSEELDFRTASLSRSEKLSADVAAHNDKQLPSLNSVRRNNGSGNLDSVISDTVNVYRTGDRAFSNGAATTSRLSSSSSKSSGHAEAINLDFGISASKSYDFMQYKDSQSKSKTIQDNDVSLSNKVIPVRNKHYVTTLSVGRDMSEPPLRTQFEHLHSNVSGGNSNVKKTDNVKISQSYKV